MKLKNKFLKGLITLGSLLAVANTGQAQLSPEERGLEIAVEADLRNTGFGDTTAGVRMILKNRHGQSSEREMKMRSLEQESDGDKSLITFDKPRDVKGTAFLSFTHALGQDDQWLYLPALKRVKRISSNNKSGPFVGSEFAYEDLSSQEVEKYTYKYMRDEVTEGQKHFVIERIPVDPKSGYTRQVVWIDQDEYRIQKVDYYDRKSSLLKTLTFKDYNQYLEKYWRANELFMVNHQTGKSTDLIWSNYQFQSGLTETDFDQRSLKKAR